MLRSSLRGHPASASAIPIAQYPRPACSSSNEIRYRQRRHQCRRAKRRNSSSPRRWISSRPSPTRPRPALLPVCNSSWEDRNMPGLKGLLARRRTRSSCRRRTASQRSPRSGGLLSSCARLSAHTGCVPQLERPQLPIETQPHSAIDLDDAVGDFWNPVRRVIPQIRQRLPQELLVFPFSRTAQESSNSLRRVVNIFRHLQRGKLCLLPRVIFQRLPIEREAFIFSRFGGRGRPRHIFLVKPAASFVAEHLAFEHLAKKIWQIQPSFARIGGRGRLPDTAHVSDHMPENV